MKMIRARDITNGTQDGAPFGFTLVHEEAAPVTTDAQEAEARALVFAKARYVDRGGSDDPATAARDAPSTPLTFEAYVDGYRERILATERAKYRARG